MQGEVPVAQQVLGMILTTHDTCMGQLCKECTHRLCSHFVLSVPLATPIGVSPVVDTAQSNIHLPLISRVHSTKRCSERVAWLPRLWLGGVLWFVEGVHILAVQE